MDSFSLIDTRIPVFMLKTIVQKMNFKSQINLAMSSKFGLELVEVFATQDFNDYCSVKAEIYKNSISKRRKLQKVLRCGEIKTLDELEKMREEMKTAAIRIMADFIEDKSSDFMVYVTQLYRIQTVKTLIAENIDLWSQLLM